MADTRARSRWPDRPNLPAKYATERRIARKGQPELLRRRIHRREPSQPEQRKHIELRPRNLARLRPVANRDRLHQKPNPGARDLQVSRGPRLRDRNLAPPN